MELLLRKKFK